MYHSRLIFPSILLYFLIDDHDILLMSLYFLSFEFDLLVGVKMLYVNEDVSDFIHLKH